MTQKISPFLWFDMQAEEAANFYTSIFPDSSIQSITRYGEGMPVEAGTVLTVNFTLKGQEFIALNGGPLYKFTEAVSFLINCADQAEVDYYWNGLVEGGEPIQCGWLKDKYGLCWQVVPEALFRLMNDADPQKSQRVVTAMMGMIKMDISELERAYAGD